MSLCGGLIPIGSQAFIAFVDPISPPSAAAEIRFWRCWWWRRRGTAPRVRNAYSTQHSTDIAGLPRHGLNRDFGAEPQGIGPSLRLGSPDMAASEGSMRGYRRP